MNEYENSCLVCLSSMLMSSLCESSREEMPLWCPGFPLHQCRHGWSRHQSLCGKCTQGYENGISSRGNFPHCYKPPSTATITTIFCMVDMYTTTVYIYCAHINCLLALYFFILLLYHISQINIARFRLYYCNLTSIDTRYFAACLYKTYNNTAPFIHEMQLNVLYSRKSNQRQRY